jgi:hypothetical protein
LVDPLNLVAVVDAIMLEALVGMGFSQSDASNALMRTNNRGVQVIYLPAHLMNLNHN